MYNYLIFEAQKNLKSPLILMVVSMPLIMVLLIFVNFHFRDTLYITQGNYTWSWYLKSLSSLWAFFVLPFLITSVVVYNFLIDKDSLKVIMIQPQARTYYFITKVFSTILLIILANILLFCFGILFGLFLQFASEDITPFLIKQFVWGSLSIIPITTLLLTITFYSKNIVPTLLFGAISLIFSLFVFTDSIGRYFPGSYIPALLGANEGSFETPLYLTTTIVWGMIISWIGSTLVKNIEITS